MEHSRFKQRIVGGLVLVALGAIIIPFLLDMHQGEEWWGAGNIPKKPSNGFVTRVLPLNDWSKQAQTDMANGSKQLDAVSDHLSAPTSGASTTPASAAATAPVATTQSRPSDSAASSTAVKNDDAEGWVVQLGSFSNQKNADELMGRLQKKAYRVFVEKIAQDGHTVYRVRIGPQSQRTDAEAIRDKLARELHLNAMVLHFP